MSMDRSIEAGEIKPPAFSRRDFLKGAAGLAVAGTEILTPKKQAEAAADELDLAQAGELFYSSQFPYAIKYPPDWQISTFEYPDGYGGFNPVDVFSCPDTDVYENKSSIEIFVESKPKTIEEIVEGKRKFSLSIDTYEKISFKGLLPAYLLEGVSENINGENIKGFTQIIFNDIEGLPWYISQRYHIKSKYAGLCQKMAETIELYPQQPPQTA